MKQHSLLLVNDLTKSPLLEQRVVVRTIAFPRLLWRGAIGALEGAYVHIGIAQTLNVPSHSLTYICVIALHVPSYYRVGSNSVLALVLCIAQKIQCFNFHVGQSTPEKPIHIYIYILRSSWTDIASPFKPAAPCPH